MRRPRIFYFNPRTHEGCDTVVVEDSVEAAQISIHAPTRGATVFLCTLDCVPSDFNPRTHEGCDAAVFLDLFFDVVNFNPRTHEGCDSAIYLYPKL